MSEFSGPTWTSSHIYGQGLKNSCRKLFYVQIPKCASMWVRKYLDQIGRPVSDAWVSGNFAVDNLNDYQYLIVLRDPVKRWISNCPAPGTIDQVVGNQQKTDYIFDNLKSWQWDEHSTPQCNFINGLDQSRAVFFYSDKHLSNNLQHFFESQGFTNTISPDPINKQSQDSVTVASVNAWKTLLDDSANLDKFKQTFANDYKLIKSVNFYREGEVKEHNVAG